MEDVGIGARRVVVAVELPRPERELEFVQRSEQRHWALAMAAFERSETQGHRILISTSE